MTQAHGITLGAQFVGALAALCLAATPAHARSTHVTGPWTSLVNCLITDYHLPDGEMSCQGSTAWQGGWQGVTHYTINGRYDPLTGDSSGTGVETFLGRARDGGRGTLHLTWTYTLSGATGTFDLSGRIVGGSGDFERSRGEVSFTGNVNAATGSGTYEATWGRPGPWRDRRTGSDIGSSPCPCEG